MFIIDIVHVFAKFYKRNLYVGGFLNILRTHVILDDDERDLEKIACV